MPNNIVEVHQNPNSGVYQLAKIFKRGETLESATLPELKITVDEILI